MAESEAVSRQNTPGHRLEMPREVPISQPYLALMNKALKAHGAQLRETGDYPNEQESEAYKEFTITFPPGTRRTFGLTMMRSRHFVIRFPDGFEVRGGELWPLNRRERYRGRTVLYLPVEESWEKGQEHGKEDW